MEAICKVKYIRQSPYKVRFVADLVRGKNVSDAINILDSTNKKASKFLLDSINSAIANINYNDDTNFEKDELYIKKIIEYFSKKDLRLEVVFSRCRYPCNKIA